MYREHFDLDHLPFANRVELTGRFQCPSFESTYTELLDGVLDGTPVQLLIGEPGTGRTTLISRLARELDAGEFAVVTLSFARFEVGEIIRYIANALALAVDTGDGEPSAAAFQRALAELRSDGVEVVVLIDDAEGLDAAVLNALPTLFETDSDGGALAKLVLAMRSDFVEVLLSSQLDQLNGTVQRVCHLESWDRETVVDYITAAVEAANGTVDSLFTDEALEAVVNFSSGIPQNVISICAAAMLVAYQQRVRQITAAMVRSARANAIAQWRSDDLLEPVGESTEPDIRVEPRAVRTARAGSVRRRVSALLGKLGPRDRLGGMRDRGAGFIRRATATARGLTGRVSAGAAVLAGAAIVVMVPVAIALAVWLRSSDVFERPAAASAAGEPAAAGGLDAVREQMNAVARAVERVQVRLSMFETELKGVRATVARTASELNELRSAAAPVRVAMASSTPASSTAASSTAASPTPAPSTVASSTPAPDAPGAARASAPTPPVAAIEVSSPVTPRAKIVPAVRRGPARRRAPARVARAKGGQAYQVAAGDTLWSIASRFATSVEALRARNGLGKGAVLKAGQRLLVGAGPAAAPPADRGAAVVSAARAAPQSLGWYTVRRGDSLNAISRRFTVPPGSLAQWNCLPPSRTIYPGQRLALSPRDDASCETRG